MKSFPIITYLVVSCTLFVCCKQSIDKTVDLPVSAVDTATVVQRTYYPNGDLFSETIYKHGTNTKTVKGYSKGGILSDEEDFVNDKMQVCKFFDKNGKIRRESIQENEETNKVGDTIRTLIREYDENGKMIKETHHKGVNKKVTL